MRKKMFILFAIMAVLLYGTVAEAAPACSLRCGLILKHDERLEPEEPIKVLIEDGDDYLPVEEWMKKAPSKVKLKDKGRKIKVSWKSVKKSGCCKKQIKKIKYVCLQYSTDPKFNRDVHTANVEKNKNCWSFKTKQGTVYYIRLRYVGANAFSQWSKTKRIRA